MHTDNPCLCFDLSFQIPFASVLFLFVIGFNERQFRSAPKQCDHNNMTIEAHWKGPKCGDAHLSMDQGCLAISPSLTENVEVFAQSSDCVGCPLFKIWSSVDYNVPTKIPVNTTWPTEFAISVREASKCELSYHFHEFGFYELDTSTCYINAKAEPVNEFSPVIIAILTLCALRILWSVIKRCYETRGFRSIWIRIRFGEQALLSEQDLGRVRAEDEHDLGVPRITERTRLRSLDAFRGIAIVLMIFVNYGGGGYYFFKHSTWNGLTVADLVFPWFLWIMGVSIPLSVQSQLRRATPRSAILFKVLKRSCTLFILGLFINSKGNFDLWTFRIPGVLQRFAISYLIVAASEALFAKVESVADEGTRSWHTDMVKHRVQWLLMLLFIAAHEAITFCLKVPGCPSGYLGPGGLHDGGQFSKCTGGAAGWIDRIIFGTSHMYARGTPKTIYLTTEQFDPEGALGCLTSVVTVFFGVVCGKVLISYSSWVHRQIRFWIWAIILGALGGMLCGFSRDAGVIPVNKNLWSLSFCFTTASLAFILFSLLCLIVDQRQWWSGAPFFYAGMNSIFLYIGHEVCKGYFPFAWKPLTVTHTERLVMNSWASALWICIAIVLYKKKLFFTV